MNHRVRVNDERKGVRRERAGIGEAGVQSIRTPVQLGGALTGRFTAGRQAGWATMPEARVESHSENTGKLHKNNVDTLSRPTGESATECCGCHTVETGAVGAMRAR